MKKVALTVPELDKKIKEMYSIQTAETNDDTIKKVKHALREIISNDLTDRQKQIVVMYYYENLKMMDIAEQLDINVSTVSRILARARNRIYGHIKYYFY